jgi:hypothetical protein
MGLNQQMKEISQRNTDLIICAAKHRYINKKLHVRTLVSVGTVSQSTTAEIHHLPSPTCARLKYVYTSNSASSVRKNVSIFLFFRNFWSSCGISKILSI